MIHRSLQLDVWEGYANVPKQVLLTWGGLMNITAYGNKQKFDGALYSLNADDRGCEINVSPERHLTNFQNRQHQSLPVVVAPTAANKPPHPRTSHSSLTTT